MHSIKAATINKINLTPPPSIITPKINSPKLINKKTPLTDKHQIPTIPKTSRIKAIENKRIKIKIINIIN